MYKVKNNLVPSYIYQTFIIVTQVSKIYETQTIFLYQDLILSSFTKTIIHLSVGG